MEKSNKLLLLLLAIFGLFSCTAEYNIRKQYKSHNEFLHSTTNSIRNDFAKIHMKNGEVYLLNTPVGTDKDQIFFIGEGSRYNINRWLISKGQQRILIDSIAIIETNKVPEQVNAKLGGAVLLATVDVLIGVICLTTPKACFGSCPTFYYNENDDLTYSEAEGFSSAILPSLEYADIDALNNPVIKDQIFSITMKNEALETHSVNQLKVLAYPRLNGETIYQSVKDEFYISNKTYELQSASAIEGDISELLKNNDREERFSLSDENNLSSKEEIILDFENLNQKEDLGLVLKFRQSLMTTYLIYSAISYMGDEYSDYLAFFENNKKVDLLKKGIYKELGNIDVYLFDESSNSWIFQGDFYETGPIAFNKQVLPFKNKLIYEKAKVKLVLNKGYWRLDYAALANLNKKVEPIELLPTACYKDNKLNNEALSELNTGSNHLVTIPGDSYEFHFMLPDSKTDYELFLLSKGYYLEWMREEWLADKDLYKLYQLVNNPKKYLKNEAANYKIYEKSAEETFWNSKIKGKILTHENK